MNTIGIETLSRDVRTYSTAAGLAANAGTAGGLAASPAFTNSPHLAVARERYEQSVVRQLLWPQADQPSFDACPSAVRQASSEL